MSTNSQPPSLPLPAPFATRRGRAVRVRLFVPRHLKWLLAALAMMTILAAACAAYLFR